MSRIPLTATLLALCWATPSSTLAPSRNLVPLPPIRLEAPSYGNTVAASSAPQLAEVDELVLRWNDLAKTAGEWVVLMNGGVNDYRLFKRIKEKARKAGLCEKE
jgi:hypothetical protein